MKNLWVIPTDKPSRLWVNFINGKFELDEKSNELNANHIYITSDEEINQQTKPCWCINTIKNTWNNDLIYYQGAMPQYHFKGFKKIILTTDQDLIKDGVQAINDEFLEWFVKNPSCEEIEVKPYHILSYLMSKKPLIGYRIIIPKEEPKQESCEYIKEVGCIKDICTCNTGPKQETLEEAAANLADPSLDKTDNWIAGAKWMEQQMEKLKDFDTWKEWKNKTE